VFALVGHLLLIVFWLVGHLSLPLIAAGVYFWWRGMDGHPTSRSRFRGIEDVRSHIYGRTLTRVQITECDADGATRSVVLDYNSPDRLTPGQVRAYNRAAETGRPFLAPDQLGASSWLQASPRRRRDPASPASARVRTIALGPDEL
jgi:hypothetical protein